MRYWRKIMPGAIAAVVAFGMIVFFLVPTQSVLMVRAVGAGTTVLCTPMNEGEEWTLAYLHSVNRRPVFDTLRVEGGELRIVKSRFDTFGAGIPEVSTTEHPLRIGPDGWLEYTVNRLTPDVTIFVGRVAQHTLQIKGQEIPLVSLAEPGKALHFSVQRRSLFDLWKGRCIW
jgi:hypothetical protein